MRAFVTGGAGMIGSHVARALIAGGHHVKIFDNLEPDTHDRAPMFLDPQSPAYESELYHSFKLGDISDYEVLRYEMKKFKPDVVFHLAAYSGFSPNVRKIIDTIVGGTLNVLEAAHACSVERFIHSSSGSVYGHGTIHCPCSGDIPAGPRGVLNLEGERWENRCPKCSLSAESICSLEKDELTARSPYGVSKVCAERFVETLGEAWGMDTVRLRYSLVYGPWQSMKNRYTGICSNFARQIAEGLPVTIHEDGHQIRDFLYVGDAATANVQALDIRPGVYNVCSGKLHTVAFFATALAGVLGLEPDLKLDGTWRADDARHVMMSLLELEKERGYQSLVGLEEGLKSYADWFGMRAQWQLTM